MSAIDPICLVTNLASGSNKATALEELEHAAIEAGIRIARRLTLPDDDLPTAAELDAAGIACVAVFAGDGTVNAMVTSLYGWGGAVLVLPGGTMNLLFHRLHGDRDAAAVLGAVAGGAVRRCRPSAVRSEAGDALVEVLAGPATAWSAVREAMRGRDLPGIAGGAAKAIERSVAAPMVTCSNPELGRREGYPMLSLVPRGNRIVVTAYHADSIDEYLAQGIALLRRAFRDGPHDRLGDADRLLLRNVGGEPIGLLLDGEAAEAGIEARFTLARCEVDLLATAGDD
jgi:hypothetical protein